MRTNSTLAKLVHSQVEFLIVEGKNKFSDLGTRDWFLAVYQNDLRKDRSFDYIPFSFKDRDEKDCLRLGFRTKTMSSKDLNYFKVNKDKFLLEKENDLGNFYKLKK